MAVCGLAFTLLLNGCGLWNSRPSSDDSATAGLLARERDRLEAEKRAQREAAIRDLLARNVPAETDSDKLWDGFRQTYPYHSQALALSVPSSKDGSRTLIVSEPPPHVTTGDILLPLGGILRNHSEKQQKIGYDGWVKDLAVEIEGNDSQISSALSDLTRLLFYTSYKSYVLPLPAKPSNKAAFNLDLQVTSAELKRWAVDDKETYTPVEGGGSLSLQQIFAEKGSGVFYGDSGGLVSWWVPKGQTVESSRVQARQFSLDSDLVVGALSNEKGILIFGRSRVVPVDLLPPLRVETMGLLAAVQQGQSGKLEQSYERNYKFAGRIDGHNDWAPILLSPELRDTEYGSLLNITDQLLKGWSNNGDTSYWNFKYPRPKRWPFKGSLTKQLETDELTYNWNTRGAGYTVDIGSYRLLALNRTGALPVSYIPVGQGAEVPASVSAAEEQAYDYFGGLNDANLVRVVQYAALYQIFSAFDIAKPATPVPSSTLPDRKLKELAGEVMSEINRASPQQMDAMARELTPLVAAQLFDKSGYQKLLNKALAERRQSYAAQLRNYGFTDGTPEFNSILNQRMSKDRAALQGSINDYIAQERRELGGTIRAQLALAVTGAEADEQNDGFVRKLALSRPAKLRKVPQRYAEAAADEANGWIHTPAVVVSWNTGTGAGETVIGGHNLDARVTQFRVSDEVLAGTTRVDAEGNILVNPRDIGRVNKVVRVAGRAEGDSPYALSSELNGALRNVSEAPSRPQVSALRLQEMPASPPLPPKGPPRPPISAEMPESAFGGEAWRPGWSRPRSQLPEPEPLQVVLRQHRADISDVIIIDRDPGGLISIANSETSPVIRATTTEDAVDFVTLVMRKAPDDLNIEFRGFQDHEVRGFMQSCEVRAAEEKIPREINAVFEGGGGKKPPVDGTTSNRLPGEPGPPPRGPGEGVPGGNDGDGWLFAYRQRKFDYSRAVVKVQPDIVLENGMQRSSIHVELPAADAAAPGQSTIHLGFRSSTPREVVQAGTNRVADSVRNFIRGIRNDYQALKFNLRLNSEIKKVSKEMGIDIKLIRHGFNAGKGDMYFARREDRDEPPTPDAAGCETA